MEMVFDRSGFTIIGGGFDFRLNAQFFVNQYNFYSSGRPRFFSDGPGIAYPVRATAIHTRSGFPAGSIKAFMTEYILWCGPGPDSLHGGFQIGNDFVNPDEKYDIFRPEGNACYTVSDHIEIYKLAFLSQGIGAGKK